MKEILAWLRQAGLCLLIAASAGYGFYTLMSYTLPLYNSQYRAAVNSYSKDTVELFYKAGVEQYEASLEEEGEVAKLKLTEAKTLLNLAYEQLLDEQGKVHSSSRAVAGKIQFAIGKCLQRMNKKEHAIKAYEESLRLDPTNLACKFNLEMLKSPPPPSGGGGGAKPKPDDKGGKNSPQI